MKRIVSVLVVLAVFGTAAMLWRGVSAQSRAQARKDALVAADRALDRLEQALSAHLRSLESKVDAAAARPQLTTILSSLHAEDDPQGVVSTLRDGFTNEAYWEPFRREFSVTALSLTAAAPELVVGATSLSAQSLINQAREQGLSSGLVAAGDEVLVAAADRIVVAARSLPAVLVLAAPLGDDDLVAITRQVGAAVVLANGQKPVASAGPEVAVRAIESALLAANNAGPLLDPQGQWAAAQRPLLGTLSLWVYANAHASAAEAARTATVTKAALAVAALVIGALALFVGFRPTAPAQQSAPAASPSGNTAQGLGASLPVSTALDPSPPGNVAFAATAIGTTPPSGALAVFGRYTLLSPLGEGGMARVFTAVTFGAEGFRRRFVVKRLRPELANDAAVVAQFIDEAKLGSSMVHSNIIPVFDFGKVGDEYYLATEYILGRDVGHMVARTIESTGRALPVPVILAIAAETLKALDYAHNKHNDSGRPMGIVHRDVSPSNILVSAGGEVKLFDFGIVKAEDRVTQTQHGVVKGNVSFMSPEQARGTQIDGRADLFSLGLVMYYAATGQTLYPGATMYELLVAAAQGPGSAEVAKLAALPTPLAEIVQRALQSNPELRFASAREFLAAIAPHLQGPTVNLAGVVNNLFAKDFADEERRFSAALPLAPSEASGLPQTGTRRT